jgi:hypothetical protein
MYIVLFYDTLCVDRLSLWICVLLSLSCILYFSGIVLYYLDCDVALYFHTLILYISLVILSMCIVMLCTSLTDWWFILHRSFCLCVLWCYVLLSQIDGLYFTGHFVYVYCDVMYFSHRLMVYISQVILSMWMVLYCTEFPLFNIFLLLYPGNGVRYFSLWMMVYASLVLCLLSTFYFNVLPPLPVILPISFTFIEM